MISKRIKTSAFFVFLLAYAFSSSTAEARKKKKSPQKKGPPPINEDAKRVAKAIPKFKRGESKKTAETQMTQLIHLLANTNRDSVSSNSALLKKAMDFRDDIGPHQKTTTIGAILQAWDAASDYGALSNHHFIGVVTRGRHDGERLVFENIVPKEELPECTGYIGNLRLVPAPLARKQGEPLCHRDEAYAIGLRQMMRESKTRAAMLDRQKSKVGHLGLTPGEHRERWLAEVALTGDAYKQTPNLQLLGQKMSTPSKMNGNIYRLRVEVTNMSRHPTEVEIESTIVGYTDNDNRIYEMKRDKRVLQLRRSEVHEYIISTPNVNVFKEPLKKFDPKKSQKVIYRGFTIIAKFNGDPIDSTGSDGRMMRVASGEYLPPKMITKASRMGGSRPPGRTSWDLIQFANPKDLAAGQNGTRISSGPFGAKALMADENRMYRLDSGGGLWIYEEASFTASSHKLGEVFAGDSVQSLFCDGSYYYIHLNQSAGSYSGSDVVQFSSVGDLITGENGTLVGQAADGSECFMADGKSFYKIHHGNVQEALFRSQNLKQVMENGEFASLGKMFCGKSHSGMFSDGTHYYILLPAGVYK